MIELFWRRKVVALELRREINPQFLELETAKQILEEVLLLYRY